MGLVGRAGRGGANVVDGVVAGPDRRPQHPALVDLLAGHHTVARVFDHGFGIVPAGVQPARDDQALNLDILVDGFGLEIAAKGSFRVKAKDRHEIFALIAHQDRFFIGQKLGKQRQAKQDAENDQRPEGALVAAKIAPAALVDGAERHASRLSKSMRGSTNTYIRSDKMPTTSPTRPNTKSEPKMIG